MSARTGSVRGMTWRYDQNPGSDVTLLALYDAVVAAEEFDLTEQAHADASWAEIRALYDQRFFDIDPTDTEVAADDDPFDGAERPRMSQAVGLIEHLLGGRSIAES